MLDDETNVLLVNFNWDGLGIDGGFWACPGGGIDDGETPEAALKRELWEELGLDDAHVHGAVWRISRTFPMAGWDGQTDTCFSSAFVTLNHSRTLTLRLKTFTGCAVRSC